MSEDTPEDPGSTGVVRSCLVLLGLLFTAFGAVGAFLPLLPTTPFLLLAVACFARSSPARHQRLLANRVFGQYISQWHDDRTVTREAKWKACGLVVVTFALSIALVDGRWLRATLGAIGTALLGCLVWLPTRPLDHEVGRDPGQPPT